jgi:hypothetical protein
MKLNKGGIRSLKALVAEHGNFVGSVWRTPSGGLNVLFHKPPDTALTNFSPWAGIDVRADNGWVVLPSNHSMHGRWEWVAPSDFRSSQPLPATMLAQLHTGAGIYETRASNSATVAFIERSPLDTSLPAMQAFSVELAQFRGAAVGSRHAALGRILAWAWGMNALNLRWALEQIHEAWLELTPGEGRADEVEEYAAWVTAQEMAKRNAGVKPPGSSDSSIFINWHEFAQRDSTERQWLVEGFWPWGRSMALWAGAKEGKSELVLWCAGCLALGRHPWTGEAIEPIHVAYFDFEMSEDDLEQRLSDLDFDPLELDYLHYAIYPILPPLDTEAGGEEFIGHVEGCKAQAVVIDTFGRGTAGEENKSDTVHNFYRHTAMRLKQMGVGYLRLDHAGKDPRLGQRGTSAKRDDVDVAWHQKRTGNNVELDCEGSSRLSWVGPRLLVNRVVAPRTGLVRYVIPTVWLGWTEAAVAKAKELDDLGAPLDISKRQAITLLQSRGYKPGRIATLLEALRCRKTVQRGSGTTPTSPIPEPEPGTAGNPEKDLFSD